MDNEEGNKGKELLQKAQKAFTISERANVESVWAELAEFILPSQNSRFFDSTDKGTKKDLRKFDSTAVICNRDLASAMHSTITNPAMKWSKLRFKETELNDDDAGSLWLDEATDAIHDMLNDSNFDSQIGQSYQSLCGLGTMVLFHEEPAPEKNKLSNFIAWHVAEIAYAENDMGNVDTIYRKFNLTLKQAKEKFGDKIGDDIVEKCRTSPLEEIEFYHCIYPREDYRENKSTMGKAPANKRPFASCYVMTKGAKLVLEEGYYEFPVYCGRWSKLPGENYGYGPGHVARPDVRTLNKLREEGLKALAKAVNPPIIATQNNIISADFRPGKITVVRDGEKLREFITGTNFNAVKMETEELKGSIKSAFYIDKLLLPPRTETGEMTAYEISQRLEQMQTILGPVLSRLNAEFLTPFIMRCLKILIRNQKIKPLPASLVEKMQAQGEGNKEIDLDVMFVNSLARSQQLGELRNVQTFIQEMMGMAQLDPSVLDKVDFDAVADYSAKIRGIPEKMIRSDEAVKATRDQRAQQQEMAQGLAAGEQVSNIAKNLSTGGGTPSG